MPGNFRSGRLRTPTALKVLRGQRIRGRHQEPSYPPGIPEKPESIGADPLASAYWDRVSVRLERQGVLNLGHGEQLALLCHYLADFDRDTEQLQKMGYQRLIIDEQRTPEGQLIRRRVRENPLVRMRQRNALLASRFLTEFGMTPVSQSKVNAQPPSAPDPFEVFLGGARPR
jgi:P27 family predicted phage terminase small subunit